MKTAIISLLLSSMFLVPNRSHAQQWSNDPVTDSIKKGTEALIQYQGWLDYCKGEHSHDKECAGIYDHIPWTYMNYDDALKLGQKQLAEEKARKEQAQPEQISVVELARRNRYLALLVKSVTDFCGKNPTIKSCSERTAYKNALLLLPSVLEQAKKEEQSKAAQEATKK